MLTYNHEYPVPEKVRLGFLGCGDHAYRNLYPALQYAPVELVAVCDRDPDRAQAFQRQFGAQRCFTDYDSMLAEADLQAVLCVSGYDEHGITHAQRAVEALTAGCHVLAEKPPANCTAEIDQIRSAEERSGKFFMCALKKAFSSGVQKCRELLSQPRFGKLSTLYVRYPTGLPPTTKLEEPSRLQRHFLDHLPHPGSVLLALAGLPDTIRYTCEPGGGGFATLRFPHGAVACLHLAEHASGTSFLERLEAVGEGEDLTLDNGTRLTYYRSGQRGDGRYGRRADYTTSVEKAPLLWEPEFSLGEIANKNLFLLGYAQEIRYFCACVLADEPPTMAGSDWCALLTQMYEAFFQPPGTEVPLTLPSVPPPGCA